MKLAILDRCVSWFVRTVTDFAPEGDLTSSQKRDQ